MDKRTIRTIIAVMALALTGIIVLQVKWILHDFRLKEQQFEQSVNHALENVVDRFETKEAVNLLHNRLFNVNTDSISEMMMQDTVDADLYSVRDTVIISPDLTSSTPPPVRKSIESHDTKFDFLRPGNRQSYTRVQHRNIIKTDSVSRKMIRSSQITRIYGDSAEVIIRQNEEKIKARLSKLNEVMQQMAYEFVGNDEDVRNRLRQANLDSMLRAELSEHRINLDFDYCVVNYPAQNILLSNHNPVDSSLFRSRYKVILFPHDLISRPDYLVIRFPETFSYFLNSMWVMLLSSTLLTFILIFGFTYTIQIILRQKKVSEIKTDFINNMTHEFKTPLATISLAVDSLRNPKAAADPEKFDYFTRIIREENKRMNNQVERVLQMAQIDKGKIKLQLQDVDLHAIIGHAVEQLALQVENRNGSINTDLKANPSIVHADPVHLSNIVFNLLDNANKYSPVNPTLNISTRTIPGGIITAVSDQGIGMSREEQKHIFEKFYRAHTGNIHDIKGFGLGLSYVDVLLKEHGGWIRVSSEPGKGSTFEFYLPTSTTNNS